MTVVSNNFLIRKEFKSPKPPPSPPRGGEGLEFSDSLLINVWLLLFVICFTAKAQRAQRFISWHLSALAVDY